MIYKFLQTLILLFGIIFVVQGQNDLNGSDFQTLNTADSLFANKKYTEALSIYTDLYERNIYSPAMLLRMGFINEGLDNKEDALLYLYQYYKLTSDRKVLEKITALAEANELQGYEYSDQDYVLNMVRKYQSSLLAFFSALLLLSVAILIYQRRKQRPIAAALTLQIIASVFLFIISNQLLYKNQAVISAQNAILMDGPSAGADPISALRKGNKIKVIESSDIWTKIEWNNQIGYIRNSKISPI